MRTVRQLLSHHHRRPIHYPLDGYPAYGREFEGSTSLDFFFTWTRTIALFPGYGFLDDQARAAEEGKEEQERRKATA